MAVAVTPGGDVVENEEDEQNLDLGRRRAPNFNYAMAGVAEGSLLVSTFDEQITGQASGRNRILVNGQDWSLSMAAVRAAQASGYGSTALQGPAYWTHGGRTLLELRREREAAAD